MKSVVILVLTLTLALAGCNAIQVVDNTYGPMGGQRVQVSDALDYLGNPNVYSQSYCVTNCPTFDTSGRKVRSDVFAAQSDGRLAEVVVIERETLSSNYYWRPVKGTHTVFGGKAYGENYYAITKTTDDPRIVAYMNFLKTSGYDVNISGMVFKDIVRNINDRTRVNLIYGFSLELIPENIAKSNDPQQIEKYLNDMFEKRLGVVDS